MAPPRTALDEIYRRHGAAVLRRDHPAVDPRRIGIADHDVPRYVLTCLRAYPPHQLAEAGRVLPSLKIRDFNFTSLSEAV